MNSSFKVSTNLSTVGVLVELTVDAFDRIKSCISRLRMYFLFL